uniref:LEM domain-containing protein n=1 Tax=Neogobius melanostomus TaxID=47308 RepID=A0A8C6WHH6_9GOBI
MSLSEKSDSEISALLKEYGIKHGPIVDSTRRLYEKKLEAAMEEAPQNQNGSSDKTYYREEEVVTYITYHSPPRNEASGNVELRHRDVTEPTKQEEREEEESALNQEPITRSVAAVAKASRSSAPSKPAAPRSTAGRLWSLIRLLLLLALFAAAGYFLLSHVMSSEGKQQLQE